jgi:hypothetical protein
VVFLTPEASQQFPCDAFSFIRVAVKNEARRRDGEADAAAFDRGA